MPSGDADAAAISAIGFRGLSICSAANPRPTTRWASSCVPLTLTGSRFANKPTRAVDEKFGDAGMPDTGYDFVDFRWN
jgi:hypothetical protein